MAKSDSKTNVSARTGQKSQQAVCRYCGKKANVVRLLTPSGKAQMFRKCCAS